MISAVLIQVDFIFLTLTCWQVLCVKASRNQWIPSYFEISSNCIRYCEFFAYSLCFILWLVMIRHKLSWANFPIDIIYFTMTTNLQGILYHIPIHILGSWLDYYKVIHVLGWLFKTVSTSEWWVLIFQKYQIELWKLIFM